MHRKVFVSWAHSRRGWTPDQQAGWRRTVIEFARLLDRHVDVEADFFRSSEAGIDWTRYGARAVKEADALHGLFDRDQRAFQEKVVIAILPGEDARTTWRG
jgi:hypothetical protein